ncbi:MAG: hypothetical protein O7J95_02740, partial [Planctomycetota bacterium]|nr:hypothetical protein [Planctomycetota bacterium]
MSSAAGFSLAPPAVVAALAEVLFRGLPWWVAVLLLPPLLLGAVLLYRRDRRSVTPAKGWFLTVLRGTLVLLLGALLMDPADRRTTREERTGSVLVVVDDSASMALADADRGPEQEAREARSLSLETIEGLRRIDLVREALSSDWFDDLQREHAVFLLRLADEIRPLAGDGGGDRDPELSTAEEARALERLTAEGSHTDLGAPLVEAVLRRPRGSVAAVILFSDGNDDSARASAGRASPRVREAGRRLASLQVPIIAVGVGSQVHPRDAAILGVEGPSRVFSGDDIHTEITLRTVNLAARELTVTVEEGGRQVAEYTVEAPPGDAVRRWPISFPSGEPGRKRFRVAVPPLAGEASDANNRRDFWVDVLSSEARVLYVDGGARWEYRFLENTWNRDESVDLDAFLVTRPPDRRLPEDFPRQRERLFGYDVVVIGDVESELFTPKEQSQVAEFVTAHGGTLILIAGPRAMPYSWSGTPLEALLPVELAPSIPTAAAGARLASSGLQLALTPEGERLSELRLVPGRERNSQLWGLLPTLGWVNPVRGLRAGSTALARLETRAAAEPPREDGGDDGSAGPEEAPTVPVFASRVAGFGKVFYAGTDSTWKWRFRFGDLFYQRFWRQLIRWAVAERPGAADDHARLGTNQLLYDWLEPVEIQAIVEVAPGRPLEDRWVDAVIRTVPEETVPKEDGLDSSRGTRRVRLERIPHSGGRYRGVIGPDDIRALASGASEELLPCEVELEIGALDGYERLEDRARARFVVRLPASREDQDLSCNRQLLEELAELSGGAYVDFADFRRVSSIVPARRQVREVVRVTAAIDHPL